MLERYADPRTLRKLGRKRLTTLLIEALYEEADPKGIVVSTPGIGITLSAGILGRLGDHPNRFANLAGVRSFTGIVPKIDQSGLANKHKGLTKAGDPGLRGRRCS